MSLFELFGPPNVEKLEAKRNVQGLINVLSYQMRDNVRQAAAEALGGLKDARAIEPLIVAALNDSDRQVREAAAKALGQIGDPQAVRTLVTVLNDQRSYVGSFHVRVAAADALGKIGDAQATKALLDVMRCGDNLSLVAATALVQIGASAIGPLLNTLQYPSEDSWKKVEPILLKIGKFHISDNSSL